MTKYRGKYPTRIREVCSANGLTIVTTNDGKEFVASPAYGAMGKARLPEFGDDVLDESIWARKRVTLSACCD